MLHVLKMFWFVIRELIFDSEEEYRFKSKKFNSRKVALAVMLMLSLFLNIWTLIRFYDISTSYIEIKKDAGNEKTQLEICTANLAAADKKIDTFIEDVKDLEQSLRVCKIKKKLLDKKPSQDLIQ